MRQSIRKEFYIKGVSSKKLLSIKLSSVFILFCRHSRASAVPMFKRAFAISTSSKVSLSSKSILQSLGTAPCVFSPAEHFNNKHSTLRYRTASYPRTKSLDQRTNFVPFIYLTPTVRTKPTNHRVSWNIFTFPDRYNTKREARDYNFSRAY
jgi:hypothetical protein